MIASREDSIDTSHLLALETRLFNEKEYLLASKTDFEKEMRSVWVSQMEKEIKDEKMFLGIDNEVLEISDEELLKALGV